MDETWDGDEYDFFSGKTYLEELLCRYALFMATESTIDKNTIEHFIDWNMRKNNDK